jgi:7-carboxy-7-deazaguanine synthase
VSDASYPLAPQGVFLTLQGEGVMLGTPMVFVRLAGCPINCDGCDTNYTVAERAPAAEIVRRAVACAGVSRWAWVTGGEPTIHDLGPLVLGLRKYGFRVALATAGVSAVETGGGDGRAGFDFVSVSPHKIDASWAQRRGDQLNVVPGLNGLRLADLGGVDVSGFAARFVTPVWYAPGERAEGVRECVEWVQSHPGWRLGIQGHKSWGIS